MTALLFLVALLPYQPLNLSASASVFPDGRLYPQTGYTLAPEFVQFYDSKGGVPLFGYPITDARTENGYLVQWTERERLEWHPENAGTQFEVLLGLLGRELTGDLQGPRFMAQTQESGVRSQESGITDSRLPTPDSSFKVSQPFLSYWQQKDGLAVFGYPISREYTDSSGLQVQWFERARFEYHQEMPQEFVVSLGLLGTEARKQANIERSELQVTANAVPDSPLQLGLAQGGESDDPGFFDNIREAGAALGPGLVRLDNIFNFYHIVSRSSGGTLIYNWRELDRVVDGVLAMGKEPFICLSYMPETLSASGISRVEPPANLADWTALVAATVTHLNVERKLGIRYWEVWNEPDLWGFWQSSFAQYLRLYDATVQAALSADPTIRIGGPAFSNFMISGMSEFMAHEVEQGPSGRVDFLSWHAYGQSADELAGQIRAARAITDRYPQFHPELFITEFNVLQGGSGDTSANGSTDTVEGAIALLSSIEGMQRERLDRAFLFELKDGAGSTPFWGRWGVLTNDGRAKPIYYALKSYLNRPGGMLPVQVKHGPTDGTIGLMAFGSPQGSSMALWHREDGHTRVKVTLPESFAGLDYTVALFDATHNNPAGGGDAALRVLPRLNAGDLVFDLTGDSLVLLTSINQ